MILVDPKLMEMQHAQQQRPVPDALADSLSALDQEMKAILENADIPHSEKATRYHQVLQRYLTLGAQFRHRPLGKVEITGPPSLGNVSEGSAGPTAPQVEDKIEKRVLASVPKTMEKKARLLLEHVKDVPDLSWDERGQLIYKGSTIPGSNMADLINDMLRARKRASDPKGWEYFAAGLKDSNISRELVGHAGRWRFMERYIPATPQGRPASARATSPVELFTADALGSEVDSPQFVTPRVPVRKRSKPYTGPRRQAPLFAPSEERQPTWMALF